MPESAASSALSFNDCVLRLDERQLHIGGEPAKLGARAFDLLAALIEQRGRVVSKTELLDLVWPDVVVEENNLQVQVSALRKLLGPQAIATIPGRGYRFAVTIDQPATSAAEPVSHRNSVRRLGNLPDALAPMHGRDDELRELSTVLASQRLVTVVGAGGIGKTRLVQAVAHALRERWRDGAWMVELAPLTDPALLPSTVAQTLGMVLSGNEASASALVGQLRKRELLLVLDNCEHLLAACSELAVGLLAQAPGVTLLASSQEPFHVSDEQQFRLMPLAVPDDAAIDGARGFGAVALFEARAHAADPRFVLDDRNLPAVIEICRQLDGLALAIELAAARVPLLGVEGLRSRLDDRFRLLTAGSRLALRRHQTLRAAIEWSCSLLSPEEQAVFRRLGVFAGSFSLELAQQVAGDEAIDEWAVIDHLGALVDKSLVSADASAMPRYRLMETGRAFALERLNEAGESEELQRSHALAVLALFEHAYDHFWSTKSQVRLDACLPDLDNLRAALEWAHRRPADDTASIALAGASAWIWNPTGQGPEGMRRCSQAMKRINAQTPPRLEARLLDGFVSASYPKFDGVERDAADRAVAIYRELDDRQNLYFALTMLAHRLANPLHGDSNAAAAVLEEARALIDEQWPAALRGEWLIAQSYLLAMLGDWANCRGVSEKLLGLHRAIGDSNALLLSLINLADLALASGDVDEAIERGREVVALWRNEDSVFSGCGIYAVLNLCAALTQADQIDEALPLAREGFEILRRIDQLRYFLEHFALLALKRGRVDAAARALGRALLLDGQREPNEQRARDQVQAALKEHFPAATLAALIAEGATLSDEEAARQTLNP